MKNYGKDHNIGAALGLSEV